MSDPTDLMQLDCARYAFHMVSKARYREAINYGMDYEAAKAAYAEQMRNYDGIVEDAQANEAMYQAMEAGFD